MTAPATSASVPDDNGHLLGDAEWHTPAQLHARRDVVESVYTLQKYLRTGRLHGHQRNGRRWSTKKTVYDAWVQNLDYAAQVRVCGCAQPHLAAVPGPRRSRGS